MYQVLFSCSEPNSQLCSIESIQPEHRLSTLMHISEFDYELPTELIAQQPLERRDSSRMIVVDRTTGAWTDSQFSSFPSFLKPKDVVVINNTRVFPARLIGQRYPSGGRVEVMLIREIAPLHWEALVRPGRRLKQRAILRFGNGRLSAEMVDPPGSEVRSLKFSCNEPFLRIVDELGQTPLPPYIKRAGESAQDKERYQTVFARHSGAVAAPTAGLHFTKETIDEIGDRGIKLVELTLHVGYGTFAPVRVEQVKNHKVEPELYELTEQAAFTINSSRADGGRVIAVGTTSTRTLESAANSGGEVIPGKRSAELTITPGVRFCVTDVLLTNFHLPRSSLLLLVCAFAGRDLVLKAYAHAVAERYRFYSYGDCMLIL